jgi:hypothetical protein
MVGKLSAVADRQLICDSQIAWQFFIMKCMFIKYDSWMLLDN